jgi:hypothetical protein
MEGFEGLTAADMKGYKAMWAVESQLLTDYTAKYP